MADDMVERVARALDETIDGWLIDKSSPPTINTRTLAIAAWRAAREPTAVMNNAGDELSDQPANVWRAMIDAALKENPNA